MSSSMEERIRKLFRLASRNSNKHEAERALLKAQQLMVEHQLQGMTPEEALKQQQESVEHWTFKQWPLPVWERRLAKTISRNFRGYNIIIPQYGVQFYAQASDLVVLQQVHQAARESALELLSQYLTRERETWKQEVLAARWSDQREKPITSAERNRVKQSFLEGFMEGLQKRYEQQVEEGQYALILVTPAAVTTRVKQDYPSLRQVRRRSRASYSITRQIGNTRGRSWTTGNGAVPLQLT